MGKPQISKKLLGAFLLLLIFWWMTALPRPLFDHPLATIIEDQDGRLLGGRIAADGQWRFPPVDTLPQKFTQAVLIFEDRRFYDHWGVDMRAIARAVKDNWQAGRVVSGGSTISMQVMRMARGNRPRTLWQKCLESILALRLEVSYSKEEILRYWAAEASFGGNVVGLDAAAWRYYQKPARLLSWAEAATLAVLPNSPGLIHPGRNRDALLRKRNRLLTQLLQHQQLDSTTWQLAQLEPLPQRPYPLPQLAPHLLDKVHHEIGPGRWKVSIDSDLQSQIQRLVEQRQGLLSGNGVHNMAVLVIDNLDNQCLAYVGNVPGIASRHSPQVDIIQAPRSPGSLLKPMLYSLSLQDGLLLPQQLLADIPSVYGDFRPENFTETYQGVVRADQALSRSLNIPFVRLLQAYGVPKFHHDLRQWNFDFLQQPAEHYGLSLILGGGEVSLWQITSWYSGLARTLKHFPELQSQYNYEDWAAPNYLLSSSTPAAIHTVPYGIGAGAAWHTIRAMEQLERPTSEGEWERFSSSRRLAWKTGTSFGFRDAWAIGLTPRYTIGIWVGNADGEGRPGLTGIQAAAPILFAVHRLLPRESKWFPIPYDDLQSLSVCATTGALPQSFCPVDTILGVVQDVIATPCRFHQQIHLNPSGDYQVAQHCVTAGTLIQAVTWFQLPPLQAHYYQRRHPDYRPLPPPHPNCTGTIMTEAPMAWIYPNQEGYLQIPVTWDGTASALLFSLAHHQQGKQVHWHLDQEFLGTTSSVHQVELRPPPGNHRLLATDEDGERLWFDFTVVGGG